LHDPRQTEREAWSLQVPQDYDISFELATREESNMAEKNQEQDGKLKVTRATSVDSPHVLSGFGTIAPQLSDLEPCAEPKKHWT